MDPGADRGALRSRCNRATRAASGGILTAAAIGTLGFYTRPAFFSIMSTLSAAGYIVLSSNFIFCRTDMQGSCYKHRIRIRFFPNSSGYHTTMTRGNVKKNKNMKITRMKMVCDSR